MDAQGTTNCANCGDGCGLIFRAVVYIILSFQLFKPIAYYRFTSTMYDLSPTLVGFSYLAVSRLVRTRNGGDRGLASV